MYVVITSGYHSSVVELSAAELQVLTTVAARLQPCERHYGGFKDAAVLSSDPGDRGADLDIKLVIGVINEVPPEPAPEVEAD
jgi:hypothetical protein